MKMMEKQILTKTFCLLVLVLFVPCQAVDFCTNVEVRTLTDTDPEVVIEQVSQDNEFDLHIETNLSDEGKYSILVRSELMDLEEGETRPPLYFSVGHSGSMRSWQVPADNFPNTTFAERVLGPLPGAQKLRISVSTDSTDPQRFKLTVSVVDFLLLPNQPKQATVSPNAPGVLKFMFPENTTEQNLLLKITNSSLTACTVVSVQKIQQSTHTFFDEESNIEFGSSYQTMLQKSAMIVSRDKYPEGFYLVLLVKSDNSECYKKHKPTSLELSQHSMDVTVTVESLKESIMTEDIVIDSIILVFGFYLSLGLFFFVLSFILEQCFGFELESKYGTIGTLRKKVKSQQRQDQITTALTNTARVALQSGDQVDGQTGPSDNELQPDKIPMRFRRPWWFWNQTEWQPQVDDCDELDGVVEEGVSRENTVLSGLSVDSSCVVGDNNGVPGDNNDVSVDNIEDNRTSGNRAWVSLSLARTGLPGNRAKVPEDKQCRTVDQNCQTLTEQHRQHLRSQLFSWLIVLAGIFYALPAFQMVYNHQNPFLQGGDLDLCYYNFFCVFPLGKIADFGHIFSNVGYVLFGLYFIGKVYVRKLKYERLSQKQELKTGIPEQVGIFYALGAALALEGILSGIYHICPTSANFQFDTTFMFLIAVLIFLKLYQFRHADTSLTAQLVFLVIGVALTLEVVGYFTSHTVFWIVFILIYIIFMLVFILKIYLNEKSFRRVFILILRNACICCSSERKNIKFRSLLPCIFVIFINILMAIFFAISQRPGVSRYLLAILMINMMLYEGYYVSRKLHLRLKKENWQENEGIRLITLIYLLMSVLFMAAACYFFIKELKTSAGTPAESRNLNDGCYLLIFDNHDMWHFLSAAGLYQHFMFLLTLEDYNIRYMKKRSLITVF